eukprot:TRINITY_DN11142_c0_g1_i13.p1 TRINITY_DN11142_c0_g1~~TRINITY_DN11142_c0_g1_i13.p1  ORF type:complete len:115 (-),score=24.47 TRINITY_DN11142_c0_g1_i13:53-397(-)
MLVPDDAPTLRLMYGDLSNGLKKNGLEQLEEMLRKRYKEKLDDRLKSAGIYSYPSNKVSETNESALISANITKILKEDMNSPKEDTKKDYFMNELQSMKLFQSCLLYTSPSPRD